jgi:hypothetical protein
MPGQDAQDPAFMRLSRPKWLEAGSRQAESLYCGAPGAWASGRSGRQMPNAECRSARRRSRAGHVSRR